MDSLKDQVVVVSGAAGALGRQVVRAFLKQGAMVCALDRGEGRLAKHAMSADTSGHLEIVEKMDLSLDDVVPTLIEQVHQEVGEVDILVNTVGGFTYGEPVHELSPETWQRMLSVNVTPFLNLSRAFVPDLIKKYKGKVITIGSKAALKGGAMSGAYAASKGALLRLTESMAAELADKNIQVNCVLPGTIDTPANRAEMPNADFTKWVSPEKIAEVILCLASSASDPITGATIPVYGMP